ncbi:MAG TPA: SusE domain-containing protein [Ohtaekwangia sp.]|nr:SusE domain-containing protein [Ohtaekwangia sp.]
MNYIKKLTYCILVAICMLSGCDDEKDLNLNLVEVKTLIAPEDNTSIALQLVQNPTVVFQWDQARAEDGSLVLYEIAFDQEGGDFSSPFYVAVSDGKGVENKMTMSHVDLNRIAMLGGADFFERKKFRWTVRAAKGSNIKLAAQSRIIELERPGGFDVIPTELFLTGSATEDGGEPLKMKQTDPGKFEIYTKLAPGSYQFTDAASGGRSFYIKEEDGFKVLDTDGETTYDGDEKVYRISVDFNAISAVIHEVKAVGLWYCWENMILHELDYSGDGIWRKDGVTVTLSTVPWGLEERHKYRVILNDGTADFEEWWGYVSNDSPGQDGQYGSTDPEYFYAYRIENNDQWNNAWKFDRNAIQGEVVDFLMKFNAEEPYASDYIIH